MGDPVVLTRLDLNPLREGLQRPVASDHAGRGRGRLGLQGLVLEIDRLEDGRRDPLPGGDRLEDGRGLGGRVRPRVPGEDGDSIVHPHELANSGGEGVGGGLRHANPLGLRVEKGSGERSSLRRRFQF